jgi:sugar (pentulose or hexulose) kinase
LNFWLTGERVMEYGDASGTALLNVKAVAGRIRCSTRLIPNSRTSCRKLISSDEPAGQLAGGHGAFLLGLNPACWSARAAATT